MTDEHEPQTPEPDKPGPTEETSADSGAARRSPGEMDLGSSDVILGRGSGADAQTRIGPYRILEKLGEGGMGVVYLAEQAEPIHRRVAIKVIKPGMDSAAVIARFEAERQALEKMDHPNIAKILDAGMTERQLPYFVMEFVKGVPITQHADHERLDVEERLELFIQVCEAVQHAHHKGIIHRDIKPTNVLVAWEGQNAVPKVIDFGVARATDQSGNEAAFTRHGQLIGTPEYMSPEQAEMGAQDIDTRTDVYALGVVLYELLTGVLPFESQTLRSAGIDAIRQIIREVEPTLPSKRLRTLPVDGGTTLGAVSKARRTDSRHLARMLRNDLDWVIMKCLEKRRDRRYATPSALALDLRRFLAGETVLTGPPSLSYHVGKFVRRHRAGVATAAMVGLALVAGLVVSLVLLDRARKSEAQTRELAVQLIEDFHDSVAGLPGALRARDQFVRVGLGHLDEARARAAGNVDLLLTIADAYDKIGDVAAGLRTPHVGDLDGAMSVYAKAREIRADIDERQPGAPRVIIGLAHSALMEGDVRREQERHPEAVAAYRSGIDLLDALPPGARDDRKARIERALLLVAYSNQLGRDPSTAGSGERLPRLEEADRLTKKLVQDEWDDETVEARARVLTNLADFQTGAGRASESVRYLEEAVSIRRQLFNSDPTNSMRRRRLAGSTFYLATTLLELKRTPEGLEQLEVTRTHFQFLVDADPEDTEARERLAQVYEKIGNSTDGTAKVEAFQRAVEHSRRLASASPTRQYRIMLAIHLQQLARGLATTGSYAHSVNTADEAYAVYMELVREKASARGLASIADVTTIHIYSLKKMRSTVSASGDRSTPDLRELYAHLRDQIEETLRWAHDEPSLEASNETVASAMKTLQRNRDRCDQERAALSQTP